MLGSDDGHGSLFSDKLSMFMLYVLGYERMLVLDNSVLQVFCCIFVILLQLVYISFIF